MTHERDKRMRPIEQPDAPSPYPAPGERSDVAIVGLNAAGVITLWDDGAERLFGHSAGEMLGRHATVMLAPEDAVVNTPGDDSGSFSERKTRVSELKWYQRKDGARFQAECRTLPLADGSGYIKTLRLVPPSNFEQHDAFAVLAAHLPQLVFCARNNGECTWISPQWCEYTGLSQADGLGLGWLEAVHPEDRQRALAAWTAAQTSEKCTIEHRIRRAADGSYRWHQIRAHRVTSLPDWVGTATDIDDVHKRRERDAFLLALNDALRPLADPLEIQESAMRMLGQQLDLPHAAYYIIDTYEQEASAVSGWSRLDDPGAHRDRLELGNQLLAAYRQESAACAPLVPGIVPQSAEARAGQRVLCVPGAIGLPLTKNGRLVAILGVRTVEPRHWDPQALQLIEEVAERTWAAVERSRAEAEMGAAQERYHALANSIDQGFCTVELQFDEQQRPVDFRFLEISPSFERQTGIKDTAGRWMREIAPDQDQFWFDVFGRVAVTGEPSRFEGYSTPLERWWSVYVFKISGPHRVAVLFHDITERKRAESVLRDSEKSLTQLNETLEARVAERTAELRQTWRLSRDLLAVIRRDTTMVAVNQAWTEVLGWEEHELVERSFMELTHPEDLEATGIAYRSVFDAPLTDPYEFRLRHKQGGYRWIAWTAAFANGRVFANGRDVTEQRARQAELERTQEALRQTQKLESMGQLTGGVAHDFNNLLTPIIGCLDMLQRRGPQDEREQRMVAGAIQSAERAKVLVQRLLAFARRQPLQPTSIDVAELTREMGGLLASTTGPQINVVVDAPAGLPPARADANQLEMAILNLAVNARDAMPNGGTLKISVDAELVGPDHRANLTPGRYLRLSVEDTGEGMSEETLKRAIEPFFSTKGVGKGTGLGLSMVHGLALQLGGGLAIRSTPGVGTHVELWLPQSAEPTAAQAAEAQEVPATASKGTVLLVDDEELVRFSTSDMLSELGYTVVEATSAEEALALIERNGAPDYLVTDQLMPGMSGTELARTLLRAHPRLKVLIISGFADVDAIAPELPRLTKPFRNADLAASLASLS
jgi:PAS domain S-box-containing protein